MAAPSTPNQPWAENPVTKIINYVQDRDEEGKQNDSWTPIYSRYIPRAAFLRAEITP